MVTHYFNIQLLPDPEFPATVLMNSLFSKLHKTLFDLKESSIGVSFPEYKKQLGTILRLHGTQQALEELQSMNWVGGMSGYCQQTAVMPVPLNTKFRIVSRKQSTKSSAKLRRQQKRGNLTEAQLADYQVKMISQYEKMTLPYLDLTSGSNGHKHRRYIQFSELLDHPVVGEFDQFGLSKTATIPWF